MTQFQIASCFQTLKVFALESVNCIRNKFITKKYEGKSTKRQTRISNSDQILKLVFHVPEKTTGVLFWV